MSKDYYNILGIKKGSSDAEIKKAYRQKAMEFHPDKNKGDKKSEAKFKEINEAYQTLGDTEKRKQYDTFGSAGANFGGGQQGFSGFEDLFKNKGGRQSYSSSENFDINDLFGDMFSGNKRKSSSPFEGFNQSSQNDFTSQKPKKEVKPRLDVEKTYEVPIIDLMLGLKLNIQTVYNANLKLNIPEGTKPGTKFKIKGKGRVSEGKTGDMYVIIDAKMPKNIPEDMKKLLESIKYRF